MCRPGHKRILIRVNYAGTESLPQAQMSQGPLKLRQTSGNCATNARVSISERFNRSNGLHARASDRSAAMPPTVRAGDAQAIPREIRGCTFYVLRARDIAYSHGDRAFHLAPLVMKWTRTRTSSLRKQTSEFFARLRRSTLTRAYDRARVLIF